MSYFYVYKITRIDTGEFYIGKRQSKLPFDFDHGYFGSGTWILYAEINNFSLCKELVKEFTNHEETKAHEANLIRTHANNPLCMNLTIGSNRINEENEIGMAVREYRIRKATQGKTQPIIDETTKPIPTKIRAQSLRQKQHITTEYDKVNLEQRNAELQETINKLLLEKSNKITQQSC